MKRVVVCSALAFVAGALLVLGGGVLILRQNIEGALNVIGIKRPGLQQPKDSPPVSEQRLTAEERHQRDFSIVFGDIINDLQPKQGFELDHYTLNDLITIDQNTIGLLNKITKDASNPQLKQLAEQIKTQRETELEQLFSLQKSSGHSHH